MLEGYTLHLLEERIGYRFHNLALLKQALTHSSFTNEQRINKAKNYERLEFLGDAVLELGRRALADGTGIPSPRMPWRR